jgi:hypothetical protein
VRAEIDGQTRLLKPFQRRVADLKYVDLQTKRAQGTSSELAVCRHRLQPPSRLTISTCSCDPSKRPPGSTPRILLVSSRATSLAGFKRRVKGYSSWSPQLTTRHHERIVRSDAVDTVDALSLHLAGLLDVARQMVGRAS